MRRLMSKESSRLAGTASLSGLLRRLWHHLGRRRRRQMALLLGLMLASAFAEVVSLGAVLPFLGALTAPERVLGHPLVADIAKNWGITSAGDVVLPLTVVFVAAAVVAGVFRLVLLWASTRLSYAAGADLSIEIYRRTLYQPYRVHVARNSSTVISGIYKVDSLGDVEDFACANQLNSIDGFCLLGW